MKMAEDLYFYPWESYTQNNSNSIMITGQVKTLIDPGHKHLFPQLVEQMDGDGVRPEDIGMVIYTHCHPDHMEGGSDPSLRQAHHALHTDEDAYLSKVGPDFFRAMGLPMPESRIDLKLTEGELKIGEHVFQVYHTPGHSPGGICLYWPDRKALIAGDLVFAQGVGRVDFPGGSGAQLKESIRRMSGLDVEVLLPGHGPAIVGRDEVSRNYAIIEQMYFSMI